MTRCTSTSTWVDPRRTRLAAGAATLLSSHAGHPEPPTSDTAKGGQTRTGRQPERESARRRSGTIPTASDITDTADHNSKPERESAGSPATNLGTRWGHAFRPCGQIWLSVDGPGRIRTSVGRIMSPRL